MTKKEKNIFPVFIVYKEKILLLFRKGENIANTLWIEYEKELFKEADMNFHRNCILKELQKELNISEEQIADLNLKYTYAEKTDGGLYKNLYFFAVLSENALENITSPEGELRWISSNELSLTEMPRNTKCVLEHYFQKGIHTDCLYGVLFLNNEIIFSQIS